jgi:ribokinase
LTVLVIGNATLDLSYDVPQLPAPGETVLARSKLIDAGGKGLNQAIVARRAGADVVYCAPIGDDPAAAVIVECLEREGLATEHLQRVAAATDESLIFVAPTGENSIISTAAAARSLDEVAVTPALASLGANDLLLMQGNLSRASTAWCLEQARSRGTRTMVNPAPIAFDYGQLWPSIDIAVVNEVESEALTGLADPAAAAQTLRRAGVGTVVTTLGSLGARFVDDHAERHFPAHQVESVDTTGAGDVFCGILAAAIDAGIELVPALDWAVEAASLSVTRRGTTSAFPSREELEALRGTTVERGASR